MNKHEKSILQNSTEQIESLSESTADMICDIIAFAIALKKHGLHTGLPDHISKRIEHLAGKEDLIEMWNTTKAMTDEDMAG